MPDVTPGQFDWGSLLPLYLARGLKKRSGCANDLYARSVAIDPPPNPVVLHKSAACGSLSSHYTQVQYSLL